MQISLIQRKRVQRAGSLSLSLEQLSRVKRAIGAREASALRPCECGLTKAKKENNFRISVSAHNGTNENTRIRGAKNVENETKRGVQKRKRAVKNRGTEIERGNANAVFPLPALLQSESYPETPQLFISVKSCTLILYPLFSPDRTSRSSVPPSSPIKNSNYVSIIAQTLSYPHLDFTRRVIRKRIPYQRPTTLGPLPVVRIGQRVAPPRA